MAHLHKKTKKGRPYYYIREIKRINGKPTVVSQTYLGSVERIARMFREADRSKKPSRLKTQSFGALFIANELEKMLDTIGIIDRVVPRAPREKGPSVGEYFFYAWANRLISPKSKRALPAWYRHTAIQNIRPVAINALGSGEYWEKWNRVTQEHIERIGETFFKKVWPIFNSGDFQHFFFF